MTKEEAIKMIENDIRIHHDYLSGKYRQALTMAVVALKEGTEMSLPWIRCDERLPKVYGKYLCTHGTDDDREVDIFTWDDKWICRYPYTYVIAWKPLPDAYQGEGEGMASKTICRWQ